MYTVGQVITFAYKKPPVHKSRQQKPGATGEIHDNKTGALLAKYIVLKTSEYEVEGKIITTYGHKRRQAKQ